MKRILFTTLLLAVASLGLAFPQPAKSPTTISAPAPAPTTPAVSSLPAAFASPEAVASKLNVSPKCASALITLFTSPEFLKCIPVSAFVGIIPIVTDPNFLKKLQADPAGTFKTVEPAFVDFGNKFCPAPKCSDKGVNGAIKIISDGCAEDLKDNQLIQVVFGATVFYSPLHDTVCFKSKQGGKFCWDESLTKIFSLPKSPIKIIDGGLIDSIAVADPSDVCTRCNKDVVNTFENFLENNDLAKKLLANIGVDDKKLDLVKVGIAVKCGIKFEDGKIPDKP